MKILFVCTGNTCRSPMAEGLLRDMAVKENLDLEVISRGVSVFIESSASENSVEAMNEIGIDISGHISKQLTKKDLEESDLVLTMGYSHKDIITSAYPEYEGKIHNLLKFSHGLDSNVLDPFGQNIAYYKKTRDVLREAIEMLVKNNFLEV